MSDLRFSKGKNPQIRLKTEVYELKGEDGLNGLSAYELALENGFIGTEEEWIVSLKGEKGDKGDNFTILALYPTLADLNSKHPVGNPGEIYAVGTNASSKIYIWDVEASAWKNIGALGSGMDASIYDSDGDGIVDNAERLGGNLPEYYATKTAVTSAQNTADNAMPKSGGIFTGWVEFAEQMAAVFKSGTGGLKIASADNNAFIQTVDRNNGWINNLLQIDTTTGAVVGGELMPKSGGTFTGDISFNAWGARFKISTLNKQPQFQLRFFFAQRNRSTIPRL